MKHYSLLRLKNFPAIDEKSMLDLNWGEYSYRDQVFFSRDNIDNLSNRPILGPSLSIPKNTKWELIRNSGPIIDVNNKSQILNFLSSQAVRILYLPKKRDLLKSLGLHFFLIFCYFIINYFISNAKQPEPQIVEISFGLNNTLTQNQQLVDKKQPEGQTEATKTIQDLPQLSKNASPNMAPEQSTQNDTSNLNLDKNLIFNENKKPAPEVKQENQQTKPKILGQKLDDANNNIPIKDYLTRKEEDLRKVADEKKQGVHNKDMSKPEGIKKPSLQNPPPSPFQTTEALPDDPTGPAPTGIANGINVASYNEYLGYLKNQLHLNWNTNEGTNFPKNLNVIIEFTVNSFGYLLGKPKVSKSSGNADFDNLALKAVQQTFPVSTPPPKSIQPPKTFKASFSPRDVE